MPGSFEQAGAAHPGQLADVLAAGQKVQEPKVADIPGDLQKPRCDGLKIGLHGIDHAPPFVDQAAPAPRQALEDVVLLRGCHDFLQHIAGHRQVIAELEQLQGLGRVDPIALGGGRKDLLEARQLQVVDIEQPPAPRLDQAVERPDVAVVAFHGDGNRIGMALGVPLDPRRNSRNPAAVCGISNSSSRLPSVRPTATEWHREPTSTPTRSCKDWGFSMDRSFSKQDRRIILRSRLPAEPRSLAIGTIPVDPSDDAGDGGGNSNLSEPGKPDH